MTRMVRGQRFARFARLEQIIVYKTRQLRNLSSLQRPTDKRITIEDARARRLHRFQPGLQPLQHSAVMAYTQRYAEKHYRKDIRIGVRQFPHFFCRFGTAAKTSPGLDELVMANVVKAVVYPH